ncbi:hypothetical protein HanPI659440_Chr06g0238821 [Helianthus annuus]|nr:hypothetical protein HanPI659440_Chr06g0238821 [Helianthus annuus]
MFSELTFCSDELEHSSKVVAIKQKFAISSSSSSEESSVSQVSVPAIKLTFCCCFLASSSFFS